MAKYKNGVVQGHTHFSFGSSNFDIFFNSNWATIYANEHCRKFPFADRLIRFVPPESICFFKFASVNPESNRYYKDKDDVQKILKAVSGSEFDRICQYVSENIVKLQGNNSNELNIWNEFVQREAKARSLN